MGGEESKQQKSGRDPALPEARNHGGKVLSTLSGVHLIRLAEPASGADAPTRRGGLTPPLGVSGAHAPTRRVGGSRPHSALSPDGLWNER